MREFIVDETQFTSLLTWGNAIQADVELGAIRGISVFGMGVGDTESVCGRLFGTLEAIFKTALMCYGDKVNN